MARREVVVDLVSDGTPPKRPRRAEPSRAEPSVVSLLSDDEDEDQGRAAPEAAAPRAKSPAKSPPKSSAKSPAKGRPDTADPPWLKWRGVKRVMGEFTALRELVRKKEVPLSTLELVGDDAMRWEFTIANFDTALKGGRNLNADLVALKRQHGVGHVQMELRFPRDYPTSPFALRVVLPRMRWYTGHVTAGGSVCMEILTTSGTDNSWRSTFTVEGVLLVALVNMLDCESTIVKTATGPGGRSGPLRVDLKSEFGHSPITPYAEAEASAAFSRMLAHHKRNGW
ncbi:hypothetical protein T492DRAFT_1088117 [Pavlovales sp. CCMP2436]|nr:hypothetical protein T492DRAFT_1088117 [Pavlovales sp. CCMP2436]